LVVDNSRQVAMVGIVITYYRYRPRSPPAQNLGPVRLVAITLKQKGGRFQPKAIWAASASGGNHSRDDRREVRTVVTRISSTY
jgi:hypothetical protein